MGCYAILHVLSKFCCLSTKAVAREPGGTRDDAKDPTYILSHVRRAAGYFGCYDVIVISIRLLNARVLLKGGLIGTSRDRVMVLVTGCTSHRLILILKLSKCYGSGLALRKESANAIFEACAAGLQRLSCV